MPIRLRSHGFIAVMSRPSSRMRPPLGGNTPPIRLNSVLLPAPFGPRIPRISPASTERSRPSMTRRPPNARDNDDRVSMVGGSVAVTSSHGFSRALKRDVRDLAIIDDYQFQRPLLALAPLSGNTFGL